jgi:hypothetical protein
MKDMAASAVRGDSHLCGLARHVISSFEDYLTSGLYEADGLKLMNDTSA